MAQPSAAEIFERHHLPVFRFLRRMTGRNDVAEDLTQEVFLRVVRGLESYREQGEERAWVFRIARNLLTDRQRQARRTQLADCVENAPPAACAPTVITDLAIGQALERLDEGERTVFLLREVGGLGYAEIAAVTEATPDAVRSRIYRARMTLRQILGGSVAGQSPGPGREVES